MLVTSEEALPAGSYQPITLLRISARATVVVVFPDAAGNSVHKESSEGCIGSSKFHTVSETGIVDVPCDEETVTLPV